MSKEGLDFFINNYENIHSEMNRTLSASSQTEENDLDDCVLIPAEVETENDSDFWEIG